MSTLFQKSFPSSNRYSGGAILAGLVGIIGIFALLGFSLYNEYQDVAKHAQVEADNISQVLGQEVLATFNKSDLLLQEIQRNVRPSDMRKNPLNGITRKQVLHALMKSQIQSVPEVDVLNVVNAKGDYIYSSIDQVPAINVTDRDYFKILRDNATAGLIISPPLISHRTGKWTIILSRRLNFEDGEFAGIVISVLNLNYFEEFFQTLNLGKNGMVALFDKEFRLAARYPMLENAMGKVTHLSAKQFIAKGITHAVFHSTSPLDGIDRMYSFRQLGDLGFIVYASFADNDYLAEWHHHIWQYCIAAIIFSLIVIWFEMLQRRSEHALIESYAKSQLAEDKINNLAFFDPLTQLPNRRLLTDRLQQSLSSSIRSNRKGALLLIDLDNFKTLNDSRGHDVGDQLLQQVAERLTSCVRTGDTVARFGGDEFVVLLEHLNENILEAAKQTETIGQKILATLNKSYQLDKYMHHSTPSIGATLFNDSKNSMDDLLKQADIAMYQAKKAGRNTLCFFDPKMQSIVNSKIALENELRLALENKQLYLYYQIQIDNLQCPLGAEVLLRWIHPELGMISPVQFIPIAEETGLILPIGKWVLDTACAQLSAWQMDKQNCDLILSVNVSAKQFLQSDFAAQVKEIVLHHGINPTRLKLELTESILLNDMDSIITTMNAINSIGVRFSLDDFGTGYSSLQYLKMLPLHQLKIDQSFVRDLTVDRSDKAIVDTIISMAQSLNLDVIAEGVETEEQRQYLENSGCANYQGYLFSKPIPLEEFSLLARKYMDEYLDYLSNTNQAIDLPVISQTNQSIFAQDEVLSESIDIFSWNDSFATGLPQIDEQHQRLVHLVNVLANSLASKAEIAVLNNIFDELADYAGYHFKTEESIWQEYLGEDSLETTHKRIHDGFITEVLKIKSAENTKSQHEVVEDVLLFLTNWLSFHILDSDKRMAMIVLSMQSGMSLEKAKQHVVRGSSGATKVLINASLSMYHQLSRRTLQLMKEVNERKLVEEELLQLSFYDLLTQLPNRRLLNDRLGHVMAASKRSNRYGALMFIDLDNFKPLNDVHGHVVGDLLLIAAANRLKNCSREMDTIARFGGDEFVVLLDELDVDKRSSHTHAAIVAEKIRSAMTEPYLLSIKNDAGAETVIEHSCTVSIGVALFLNHESSQDDIIRWADAAMYQAKAHGRNMIRFYD